MNIDNTLYLLIILIIYMYQYLQYLFLGAYIDKQFGNVRKFLFRQKVNFCNTKTEKLDSRFQPNISLILWQTEYLSLQNYGTVYSVRIPFELVGTGIKEFFFFCFLDELEEHTVLLHRFFYGKINVLVQLDFQQISLNKLYH